MVLPCFSRRQIPEGLNSEDLRQQEQAEGLAFQRQLYTQFMQQYARGRYTVEFQDVDRTNEVNVSLTVHDGRSGRLVYSYDHEIGGGLGSSPESIAESLMRQISRQFPYNRG